MKLRTKLFVTFVVTLGVMIIAGYFLLRWSFFRGASSYILQSDQRRLIELAKPLAEHYQHHRNWDAFQANPSSWRQWLALRDQGPGPILGEPGPERGGPRDVPPGPPGSLPDGPPGGPPEFERFGDRPDGPSEEGRERAATLPYFLLDAESNTLVGNKDLRGTLQAIVLTDNKTGSKTTVGYIGLPPPPSRLTGFRQDPQVAEQRLMLMLYCGICLVVAVLVAIPLSAVFSRRILRLHAFVSELNLGSYNRSVPVIGTDEIAHLSAHLNTLAQTLEDSRRQRHQLTADISHELRTPVANLQAYVEAMEDGLIPLAPDALPKLHEQIQRLANLINDLYQLSLADAGGLSFAMARLNLTEFVEQLVVNQQPVLQASGLTLTLVKQVSGAVYVNADEQRLQQVFSNLLENSRRYSDSPGQVQIELRADTEWVTVTVADSPPGVARELQTRLTERLFRVESSRHRRSGGAGLGLNLCAAIVSAHHGKLQFGDSLLGGLAVTLRLPVIVTDEHREDVDGE